MSRRIKSLVMAVALLCCAAGARAEGLDLAWGACMGAGGVANWQFGCATNVGVQTLFASFVAPAGVVHAEGMVLTLDFFSDAQFVPSWWTIRNVGSCRNGALSLNSQFFAEPGCADFWQGAETVRTIAWSPGYFSQLNRGRLVATVMLLDTLASVTAEAGTEYHALKYAINNVRTVGSGSCDGCLDPACLVLSSIRLVQYKGASDIEITSEATRRIATWQGSISGECQFVPARRQTWGAIKSLWH